MKKSIIFSLLIIAIFFFGCKSQQKVSSYSYDDVYSTKTPHATASSRQNIQNEDLSATQQSATVDTSTNLKATAASGEDYSSNSYSSRIKRFNDKNPGLSYDDPYYSGSSDSTSSGGSSPNVNFYFGNSWGSLFWGNPYSWYDPFYYDPFFYGYPYSWYSPYYYWYNPYYYNYWDYPYYGWSGHGHHHNWDWHHDGDRNLYYGRRNTLTSPDGGKNSGKVVRTATGNNNQSVDKGQNTRPAATQITRSTNLSKPNSKEQIRVTPDKQRYTYSRGRTTTNTRFTGQRGNTRNTSRNNYSQRQQPVPRYSRPSPQQQGMRSSNTQTYTSPAYRQPKSSQEYINPRSQPGRPSTGNDRNTGARTYSNPNPSGRRYTTPSNSGNSRIYSTPSNSGRSYSTPSRSYPSSGGPSRSSGSGYSAPSHSSPAPSHSGGSSGSGSSGSGGRRR